MVKARSGEARVPRLRKGKCARLVQIKQASEQLLSSKTPIKCHYRWRDVEGGFSRREEEVETREEKTREAIDRGMDHTLQQAKRLLISGLLHVGIGNSSSDTSAETVHNVSGADAKHALGLA